MQTIQKRLVAWALVVAAILSIPLLAQWPWTISDFIFAGVVLFGSATVYELASQKVTNSAYRIAIGVAVAAAVVLIWAWAVAGP